MILLTALQMTMHTPSTLATGKRRTAWFACHLSVDDADLWGEETRHWFTKDDTNPEES